MRSIRLSLLVYFLALLAVALGTVSFLVYGSTRRALAEKNEATRQLIERQYQEVCDKERVRLDEALLADAKLIARHAQIYNDAELQRPPFDGPQPRDPRRQTGLAIASLASSVAGALPNGHLATSLWTAQATNALSYQPRWPIAVIKIDESELHADDPQDAVASVADYVQIQCNFPAPIQFRSPALDGHSLALPQEMVPSREALGPEYRDVEIAPGLTVRRVAFRWGIRAAHPSGAAPSGPGENRPPRPSGGDKPFPPPGRSYRGAWGVVLAAYDPSRLEAAIAPLRAQRDENLVQVEAQTKESLSALRYRLFGISLATFAAVVVGVYFLVRLGLLPLQRLGDAVSKVSERDFRLQFEEPRLPAELAPIVDRLKTTLGQLRHAFEREKQAAADISHELRTPVAALLTTLDVALKKPRKPEEYREILNDCRESGQQISQLVERLLTLARIDAGVDRLRVEKVDVAVLAEQCSALVRPLAEARGLTLRTHSEGEATMDADPSKLREVLTNLLHNAIQYNRPDGRVDLSVRRQNGTLRVEVSDTGIGIAPEARAHIFERFYRADPSRHAEGMHAGLGLAIVKGYIDLMGGSIAVESAQGQGSTFRVELPAA
jgi:heavy metal sensor kinase